MKELTIDGIVYRRVDNDNSIMIDMFTKIFCNLCGEPTTIGAGNTRRFKMDGWPMCINTCMNCVGRTLNPRTD